MQFGISTACMYPQHTEKTVEYFCKNGVKNLEIFINTFSEMTKDYLTEIKKITDSYGTKIVSLHPFSCAFEPFMFFTDYERRFLDALEFYKPYFEACNITESNILVFHGDRKESPCTKELYFERFEKLHLLGRQYGVTVAQENVARCKSRSSEFIAEMSKALGDNVRFVLDTKQVVRAGQSLDEMIAATAGKLAHIHLSDHSPEHDCLPLGEGDMNIDKFFADVTKNGFDGCVILELYRENFKIPDELLISYNKMAQIKL